MYDFVKRVKNIERNLKKIRLFELLLTFAFIFLFFNLLFFIFDIPRLYAFSIAVAYLIIKMTLQISKFEFFKLAENFGFKDKLKAAWDNVNLRSVVVEYLALEVLEDLSYVKLNPFVRKGRITLLVLGCILLSFSTIYLTTNEKLIERGKNWAEEFKDLLKFSPIQSNNSANKNENTNLNLNRKIGAGGDIYGKPSIASLENTANIKFQLGGVESITTTTSGTNFNTNQEIGEINPVVSEAYHENIPQAYEEVVKRYFEKLRVDET